MSTSSFEKRQKKSIDTTNKIIITKISFFTVIKNKTIPYQKDTG